MSTDVCDPKLADQPPTRTLSRRTSRSTTKPESPSANEASQDDTPGLSSADVRVTKAHSEEADATPASESKKRTRRGGQKSTRTNTGHEDTPERGTRNSSQRLSKDARDAKKHQRDQEAKRKMAELDLIEAEVKAGTHPQFIRLIQEIDNKRQNRTRVADGRRRYAENNRNVTYDAAHKAAQDHFQLQKQNLRRQMMEKIQQQISQLEQEYHSCHTSSSLDNQHVAEWKPAQRPTRLDSVILSLPEHQIQHDLDLMKPKRVEVPAIQIAPTAPVASSPSPSS